MILGVCAGLCAAVLCAVAVDESAADRSDAVGAGTRVALVTGTTSLPNAGEANYARALTRHMSHWLDDVGIEHVALDDEQVVAGLPACVRVAVLVYNSVLPPGELTALRAFVARGGRLIVFFSADPGLAALMGMTLGDYRSAERAGTWSVIRFNETASATLPASVRQDSRHIRVVHAVPGKSRVAAVWENAVGVSTGDAAWVRSETGWWMSHVLLADGDDRAKARMLLGMIAALDPAVWPASAARCLALAGQLGGAEGYADLVRRIRRRVGAAPRPAQAAAALARAADRYGALNARLHAGDWAAVVQGSDTLRRSLIEAYACTYASQPDEFRGVWEHSGLGLYPGDWGRTCELLAAHGIRHVFVNVLWPGLSHGRVDGVPGSRVQRVYGDQLEACVRQARRHGIRVHVWKVCWNLDRAEPDFVATMAREGRLQVTDKGVTIPWLCPSDPRNRDMEVEALANVTHRYGIDGVHLDYVRFPNSHACYCPGCRRRFEVHAGRPVPAWPGDVLAGERQEAYRAWRAAVCLSPSARSSR